MDQLKRLLRGVIDFGKVSQESLANNFQRLRTSGIQWTQPADERIYTFVRDFFASELDMPSAKVMADFFVKLDDIEAQERLKDIKGAPSHEGVNYTFVLKNLIEEQNRLLFMGVVKESQDVATKGLVIGEGRNKQRIHGVKDAIVHFQRKSVELLVPENNAQVRGDLRAAASGAWEDYEMAKAHPEKAYGAFCGLEAIDKIIKGLKPGRLWVHAAFTGELKSTFAINWCYNQVTQYRNNVFYVSLEMPFKEVRDIIMVLHSAHPKWERKPLDYEKILDGSLTPEDEAFFRQVVDDFENNPEHCRFELWCPDQDATTVSDIQMEAELLYKQMAIGMLVVDHGGLVTPNVSYRDFNIALNSVLRDCKKLALHFNQGQGIPVLALFQINRDGKDAATKDRGRYKLRALSHANEAERSADVVTTSFLDDELKEAGRTIMGNMKHRGGRLFKHFEAGIDFSCLRMYNVDPGEDDDHEMMDADDMDEILGGVGDV